jgi:hypothetical protein
MAGGTESSEWLQYQANGSNVCRALKVVPRGQSICGRGKWEKQVWIFDIPGALHVQVTIIRPLIQPLELFRGLRAMCTTLAMIGRETHYRSCLARLSYAEPLQEILARFREICRNIDNLYQKVQVTSLIYHSYLHRCLGPRSALVESGYKSSLLRESFVISNIAAVHAPHRGCV